MSGAPRAAWLGREATLRKAEAAGGRGPGVNARVRSGAGYVRDSKTIATMKLCRVDNELLTCDANHPHLARRCLAPASHYARFGLGEAQG
jgi:hypothetical protein